MLATKPKNLFLLDEVKIHKEKENWAKQNDDKWQQQQMKQVKWELLLVAQFLSGMTADWLKESF